MRRKQSKRLFIVAAVLLGCLIPAVAEIPPVYVGVEGGYGASAIIIADGSGNVSFGGLELTPVIGTYPLGTRNFGLELNVQMAFQNCLETGFDDVSYTVFTPQLVAVYNFTSVPFVQPYIGAGIGYNINSFSGFDTEVDMANAFSFVTKGGVRYNIPGTTMLVLAYIKYNFNMTELTESYGGESWKADINAGTLSFGLGFGYVF